MVFLQFAAYIAYDPIVNLHLLHPAVFCNELCERRIANDANRHKRTATWWPLYQGCQWADLSLASLAHYTLRHYITSHSNIATKPTMSPPTKSLSMQAAPPVKTAGVGEVMLGSVLFMAIPPTEVQSSYARSVMTSKDTVNAIASQTEIEGRQFQDVPCRSDALQVDSSQPPTSGLKEVWQTHVWLERLLQPDGPRVLSIQAC